MRPVGPVDYPNVVDLHYEATLEEPPEPNLEWTFYPINNPPEGVTFETRLGSTMMTHEEVEHVCLDVIRPEGDKIEVESLVLKAAKRIILTDKTTKEFRNLSLMTPDELAGQVPTR